VERHVLRNRIRGRTTSGYEKKRISGQKNDNLGSENKSFRLCTAKTYLHYEVVKPVAYWQGLEEDKEKDSLKPNVTSTKFNYIQQHRDQAYIR
jgi:hypothetical protein